MSANIKTLSHYRELEGSAKEAANSRDTIDQLRQELHRVIADLTHLASKIHTEVEEYDLLISRAKATLLRTLPGGDDEYQPIDADGHPLTNLDAMPKPQRRETLRDAMLDIAIWEGAGMPGKAPPTDKCDRCGGTGCIDTPFSGSDPCCPECDGEGVVT